MVLHYEISRENALQVLLNFGALRMQHSTGARRVRWETRTTSAKFAVKSVLRLAARLRDVGVWNRAKFCEKTRELAANFIEFRCTAHAELGWRAPRALHNMHGVATVLGEVSAVFGGEMARCRRLEMVQNFAKNARTYRNFR